ncbi:MAG TPA: tetratricopeptide repeat protein [Desulfobulbaceae bacterium]|nr:tetratricopeptide repeat protein [Desulfobulbaceae bacterium]
MAEAEQLQNLYQDALELHEQGEFQAAAKLYEKILARFPDADLVLYNLGLALYEQEQFPEAAAAFLHAAGINPNDPDYWFNAGLSLKQTGEYQQAVAAYEQAAMLQPEDVNIFYNLGCCLQAAGNVRAAAHSYEKALDLVPEYASALGNLAYCLHWSGDHAQATELYRRLLDLQPDHVSARYMLDALEGKNTAAPPPEYVQGLFDGYSDSFDKDLLENLSYRVPTLLARLLKDHIGLGKQKMRVVDLGCGTGLAGQAVLPYASHLSGVDLSANMVVQAEKKGCYDQLVVGDVIDAIHALDEPVDLLLAADVLTYLGDLKPLFLAILGIIGADALFCFSTELGEENGWQLRPTGRYGHHPEYIRRLAKEHGWEVVKMRTARIRKERDDWVTGNLYLLRKI